MPYPFALPTTSSLLFSDFIRSDTHPSLVIGATTHRNVLRSVLKTHRRLPPQSQASNLTSVVSALNGYLPYLFALDSGLGGVPVNNEEIDVVLVKEVEAEWRPSLSASLVGSDVRRIKEKGLDYELCFAMTTLAFTYYLMSRSQLHGLYASTAPSAEQRTSIITSATKYLLQANSVHEYLTSRTGDVNFPPGAIDVSNAAQNALASFALAEATSLAILKDDPYPAVVLKSRNKNDNEWMFKAPDIPKVRAHLFARLGLQAAEHAGRAHALLSGKKGLDDVFLKYVKDLQRVSRAKACRFFGIDAELGGKVGEGIGWLGGGKKELGLKVDEGEASKVRGLAKLKKNWSEKREDKKIEKGMNWGVDAGRTEEVRVIEMLEEKWNHANNIVSVSQMFLDTGN